jgi:hypothetical protein
VLAWLSLGVSQICFYFYFFKQFKGEVGKERIYSTLQTHGEKEGEFEGIFL